MFYLLYYEITGVFCFLQTRAEQREKEWGRQDGQLDVCISPGGQLNVWHTVSLLLLSGYFMTGRCVALVCLYCSIHTGFVWPCRLYMRACFFAHFRPYPDVDYFQMLSLICKSIWNIPKYAFCTHRNAATGNGVQISVTKQCVLL